MQLFSRAQSQSARTAVRDVTGSFSYGDLLADAERVAAALLSTTERDGLNGRSVAYLAPPSYAWVAVTWGIWKAGGTAVPLCMAHPAPELTYTVEDSQSRIVLATPAEAERLRPIAAERQLPFMTTDDVLGSPLQRSDWPTLGADDPAMIVYTSGTTGQPKGAVLSHGNIQAQVEALHEAWGWTQDDVILEFLPLHHVHGIVNIVTCCLWSGARCDMLARFDADEVWRRLGSGELTLLMAVPTIYRRLIAAFDNETVERQKELSAAASQLRLMVSGSAALPVPVLERWREITGHVLLERYGMTEIGMALSNPLDGERVPGAVGRPLPGVDLRLVNDNGATINDDGEAGQIQVRGPAVFKGYLGRDDATRASFTDDGWFITGDRAVRENGIYRILGRESVDIIKTGGEKVSALEIEAVLREHPAVAECAVVGVPNKDWGEQVSVAVVLNDDATLTLDELRNWARERMAVYKIPRALVTPDDLPRNAMGKVMKPAVTRLFP